MFEYYLAAEKCHLKYAQGRPAAVGREFHSYDEIVLFLDGDAQLISKDIQLRLTPGNIIFIPREQFHQFVVTDHSRYRRCILGFGDVPQLQQLTRQVMTEVTVLPDPPRELRGIFETLMQAAEGTLPMEEQGLLMQSAAAQLLLGRKLSDSETIRRYVTVSALTQEALQYIDNNLGGELRLDTIAMGVGVSVSTLSHRFRKDLNISVYRYISEKRLSAVRQYIQQGVPLASAAAKSGFKDYSGFFRLYKSHYGESPSDTARKSGTEKDNFQ